MIIGNGEVAFHVNPKNIREKTEKEEKILIIKKVIFGGIFDFICLIFPIINGIPIKNTNEKITVISALTINGQFDHR